MSQGPPRIRMVIDFLALSGGEVFGRIAGFVAFAYLARVLAPESYGAVELAVALSLLFAAIVDFGMGQIGAREVAIHPERAPALAAQVPTARLLIAFPAIAAMGFTATLLGQPDSTVRLVWLFSLGLLVAPWYQLWLFQGLDRMVWISGAGAIRMTLFAVGVALLVRDTSDALRVGLVEIGACIGLGAYFLVLQRRLGVPIRLSFSVPALASLMRQGLPLGLTQLVWAATQYLPTMLVAYFIGGEAIAWFAAAHRIVMSLWVFSYLYHFNLFPALARNLNRSTEAFQELARASLKLSAWAGFAIGLSVGLLAEPLCVLVYGERFAVAGRILAVGVWVVPATLLFGHARSALIAGGLQQYVLYAQISGGIAMIAIGTLLIPLLGAEGGAYAIALSSFVVCAVAQPPSNRQVAPMLTEEAHHMFVGETGIGRIIQRTCEAMNEAGITDAYDIGRVRDLGVVDLPTIQKKANLHFSLSLDLFGSEVSTNAANAFNAGIKGRFQEVKIDDDHRLLDSTYPVMEYVDGAFTVTDKPALTALNARLRDDYIEDCRKGVGRWNKIIQKTGVEFELTLPHVAFHRQVGQFNEMSVTPEGDVLSGDAWSAEKGKWVPSSDDMDYIYSLMNPVTQTGKYADWIVQPKVGIDNKPGDFEYVKLA